MQETKFRFEVIVSEDCSTDRTRDVVVEFQQRYPDLIRLMLSEKNLNTNEVLARGIAAARGKYIALLDGDDYWTSAQKLQKQVEFLDSRPNYAICFHNALSFYEDAGQEPFPYVPAGQKRSCDINDILVSNFIPTAAVLFRRGLFTSLPDWYGSMDIGDWPLHVINAQHGMIGYIDEVMSAYRIHDNGVWTGLSRIQRLRGIIQMYDLLSDFLDPRFKRRIKQLAFERSYRIAAEYEKHGALAEARTAAKKCWLHSGLPQRRVIGMMLKLYSPLLYRGVLWAFGRSGGLEESRKVKDSEQRRD